MLKQRKGSIINFCPVSGLDSNSGNAAYGASKAAIASLTRTMAKELAKVNIRVNVVAPGFVATDMNKQIDADYMESMLPQIALERVADVSEVANTVLFLASDESSYITGQVIRIDGGM
jgi:3-oxoacyl-[acyl-carrier protein] reductase